MSGGKLPTECGVAELSVFAVRAVTTAQRFAWNRLTVGRGEMAVELQKGGNDNGEA